MSKTVISSASMNSLKSRLILFDRLTGEGLGSLAQTDGYIKTPIECASDDTQKGSGLAGLKSFPTAYRACWVLGSIQLVDHVFNAGLPASSSWR